MLQSMLRWGEALGGILAIVAGGAAITYLLLAPAYSGETCQTTNSGEPPTCVSTTATLLQVNGTTAITDLSIVAILLLGVVVSAVIHSRAGRPGARWLLWASTAALTVFTLLAILSIGPLLLPGAALALVASLCALVWSLIRSAPRHA